MFKNTMVVSLLMLGLNSRHQNARNTYAAAGPLKFRAHSSSFGILKSGFIGKLADFKKRMSL